MDGDVGDGDRVLVPDELHLQHALEAPAHEGDVGDPGGHWRGGGEKNHLKTARQHTWSTSAQPPHPATCS